MRPGWQGAPICEGFQAKCEAEEIPVLSVCISR